MAIVSFERPRGARDVYDVFLGTEFVIGLEDFSLKRDVGGCIFATACLCSIG